MVTTAKTSAATTRGNAHAEPVKLRRRIGSTTFIVNVHFSNESNERAETKILRLIKQEVRSIA